MIDETLIEKYFSKRLTTEESKEFEKRYNSDGQFKKQVDFLMDLKSVTEFEDDAQFKKQLTAYETEITPQQKRSTIKWLKPLIAVAALVIVALSVNFLLNKPVNEDTLFSTYFEVSKNVSVPIVRSNNNDNILNHAFSAYSAEDYNQAISLFEKSYQNSNNSELLFYQGNAYLALGNAERAISKFKKHLTYTDALTHRSHWFLALAYLKSKQPENTIKELKTILNSNDSFKKDEAKSLLKKLE
ncbi:tetratricopeptide repeat protein [Hwangdonia lutea]|uniref:Tetratricopeptide repeat protein n=1 Tax=Hwangdonia lutea TaxID=3075823 RepID=A0AA97HRI1_9FLAO|nr:hypothetical protein [Hwangdonia sp. SCSIO 19198]WOD44627.1 hypothetical protein RNZ46_05055 [Hwangdonia sp. SCSIO 19198]